VGRLPPVEDHVGDADAHPQPPGVRRPAGSVRTAPRRRDLLLLWPGEASLHGPATGTRSSSGSPRWTVRRPTQVERRPLLWGEHRVAAERTSRQDVLVAPFLGSMVPCHRRSVSAVLTVLQVGPRRIASIAPAAGPCPSIQPAVMAGLRSGRCHDTRRATASWAASSARPESAGDPVKRGRRPRRLDPHTALDFGLIPQLLTGGGGASRPSGTSCPSSCTRRSRS